MSLPYTDLAVAIAEQRQSRVGTVRPGTSRISQVVTLVAVLVPPLGILLAMGLLWGIAFHWVDVVVLVGAYTVCAFGTTIGFHRYFSHRSFQSGPGVKAMLAILGCMTVQGPLTQWVTDHRKHHAFSDRAGDPHSPHVGHGHGWRGAARGLLHAHLGWLFIHTHRGRRTRYAPDLLADRGVRWVDRTFLVWALGGLVAAFGLGWLFGGRLRDGVTGLLWGGAVRMLVLHHVTYSVNSLCHFFGRRRFDTGDESRNLAWLAPLSLGEAWHNNHHAFPTSAEHGCAALRSTLPRS